MKKERDILDYVSLGAELMQTARLGEIRDGVNALVQIEAHKLEAQNRKNVARLQEEKIRDFVFNAKKLIEGLDKEHASKNPAGTLVLLYGLKDYNQQFQISTMGVRSFEDKEKVDGYMAALKNLTAECEKRIDTPNKEKIAKCLKYRVEEEDLKGLISYEEQIGKVRVSQDELEQMEPPAKIFNLPIPISLALLFLAFSLAVWAYVSAPANRLTANDGASDLVFVVAFLVLVVASWGLVPKGRNNALILQEQLQAEEESLKWYFSAE